jgi:putative salt-induced outer membrane protein YdiY
MSQEMADSGRICKAEIGLTHTFCVKFVTVASTVVRSSPTFRVGGDKMNNNKIHIVLVAVFRVSGNYTWQITEHSRFSQSLNVSSGSGNTYTESVTELSAEIIAAISTVLGYTVRHNSDVAPDKDKTDTYVSISLEYTF